VWGGHPAITPLLWSAAQAVGVEYTVAVELFQSRLFQKVLPAENKHFANVTLVNAVGEDQEKSLLAMREAMLTSTEFEAAVFIGGMHGILDEHKLFVSHWPNACSSAIGQMPCASPLHRPVAPPSSSPPICSISRLTTWRRWISWRCCIVDWASGPVRSEKPV